MRSRSRVTFFHRDPFFAENPAGTAKNDPETVMEGAPRDRTDSRKVHYNGNRFADRATGPGGVRNIPRSYGIGRGGGRLRSHHKV